METCVGCGTRAFGGRCHRCGRPTTEGAWAREKGRIYAIWGVLLTLVLTALAPPVVVWSWPRISYALYSEVRDRVPRPGDLFLRILQRVGLMILSGVLSGAACGLAFVPWILLLGVPFRLR